MYNHEVSFKNRTQDDPLKPDSGFALMKLSNHKCGALVTKSKNVTVESYESV